MLLTASEALVMALGSMGMGIILLVYGGNWTIDSAVYVARRFGLSPLVVGFTIVAFGTSLPELVVSVVANFEGSPGIAIGNVLGSNIANILLVIGATCLFVTLHAHSKAIVKDIAMMLICTALIAAVLISGEISRLVGFSMVALLIGYIFFQYRMAEKGEMPEEDISEPRFSNSGIAYLFMLAGLATIALGAELLVRGATTSAEVIGVPDAVIALSIIALGTSLPELSTCIIAGRRGQTEMVLGNIIGSNVFNILMIIGLTSFIKPIEKGTFAPQLVNFDIWVVMAVSVIFSLLILIRHKVTRGPGLFFIFSYLLYNIYIYAIYLS